ncbi:unnamed protein product [Coffea canephora]|uniref:Uncharacterized protein n=1 Tax=Coffea canephora TaxID=49390 RepID=A0A068UQB6_COFCA|nr:unnamed protein product [Coffea canephora]
MVVNTNGFFFQELNKPGDAANRQGSSAIAMFSCSKKVRFTSNLMLGRYAIDFAGFSSQNPGVNTIANAVFGSNPPISSDVLTKAL